MLLDVTTGKSRQRRWQIKMKSEGRCVICGEKAVTAFHCLRHAIDNRIRTRKLLEKKRRAAGIKVRKRMMNGNTITKL
jgi:hypothetical protein